MDNHTNKNNRNFLTSRTAKGVDFIAFSDVRTPPETFYPLFRKYLQAGQEMVQARMFAMYRTLMSNTSGQPSENQGVPDNYKNLIEGIFKPFINTDTLRCNQNLLKEPVTLNNIRVSIWRFIKKITGCDQVSVVYKTIAATEPHEGISFFINDLNIIEGAGKFTYKISNHQFNLSDKSTITVVVPLKYIYLTIDNARSAIQTKTNFDNDKRSMSSDMLLGYIVETEFKRILRALIASIYKESIFLSVARQVYRTADEIVKVPAAQWDDESTNQIQNFIKKATDPDVNPNFNFLDIVESMIESKLDRMNPYSFLDLLEIRQKEVDFVTDLYVKASFPKDNSRTAIPNYYELNLDAEKFFDNESKVSAAATYLTKLQYGIIALLIATDGSVREGVRSEWCKIMKGMSGIITQYSKVSYVSNNKKWITREIDAQLDCLEELGENLIRLHQVRKVI